MTQREPYPLVPFTRRKKSVLFFIFVFSLLLFLKVWQTTKVDRLNRHNAVINRKLQTVDGSNALLKAEIEELKAQDRIMEIAKNRLGLVQAPKLSIPLKKQ